MGNLCSIFHLRFKKLVTIIKSSRKAQLIDYILLGWQSSTYKLKGSEQKWFMKPYSQIVADTGIPLSTLERYIRELNEEGFITRRQALYSRTKELGEFEVKKGTYICITDKLLSLLAFEEPKDNLPEQPKAKQEASCLKSTPNEGSESLNMRELYISDLYKKSLNNVIFKKRTASVDKNDKQALMQQFNNVQQLLFFEIKEEIPDEVKKMVSGTFFNLTFEHHKVFSSPKQLVAEYLYALLNVDFYMPNTQCFKYRNNILSKLVRTNSWRTPKGFYKHFYLGQNFGDQQKIRDEKWQKKKELEIKPEKEGTKYKNQCLVQIEAKLYEKGTLINQLTEDLYQQSDEGLIVKIRENIQSLRKDLESLWAQQATLEQQIEYEEQLCA
ncbi:MAG: hypothetical protein P4L79_03985 [Legionella sp.]|uniref:hypothetical protein n=1 Tax=Legionella sp. TaxID=459 RepID=UPI002842C6F3|nr:hypothetical protein [Legionella sp.]